MLTIGGIVLHEFVHLLITIVHDCCWRLVLERTPAAAATMFIRTGVNCTQYFVYG